MRLTNIFARHSAKFLGKLSFSHIQERVYSISDKNVLDLLKTHKTLPELKQLHALIITSGNFANHLIQSKLLKASDLNYSFLIFNQLDDPPTFIWNTMIQNLVDRNCPILAFNCYLRMLRNGEKPNKYTYTPLTKVCGELLAFPEGIQLHCQIVKLHHDDDEYLYSSLIRMYYSFGDMVSGRKVFDEMPHRNVVSWTTLLNGYVENGCFEVGREVFNEMPHRDAVAWSAMISGYVHGERFREALCLFSKMQSEGMRPNEGVLVGVTSASAELRALDNGRCFHSYVEKMGFGWSVNIKTALIDMYAKCGLVGDGIKVFDEMTQRSLLSWNVALMGLAMHGQVKIALGLYSRMLRLGVQPDGVTFLALLEACSHGGLVIDGIRLFEGIPRAYLVEPKLEHFGCMVDLLSRAGLLREASELVEGMPIKPDVQIWGALLAGCKVHDDIDRAETIAQLAVDAEPDHAGRYMLLSNIYTFNERWTDAVKTRELMTRRGVKARPGGSAVGAQGTSSEGTVLVDLVHMRKTIEVHDSNRSNELCYIICRPLHFPSFLRYN